MEILKEHLAEAHDFEFEHVEKTFPVARLFEEWKSSVENERFFNLVAVQSEQVNKKGEMVRTLVCNRSGVVLQKVHNFRSSTVQVKYKPLKINRVQYGTSTPIFFRLESSTSKSTSTLYCF